MPKKPPVPAETSPAGTSNSPLGEKRHQESLLKTGALQNAILSSANFSSIATDEKGVIQIFNVGAERMLGYDAVDVINKITPADISDPREVIARARELSAELDTEISPGFEALAFKASRGIEDIYELTYIRKDGSRFPAIVSVTALRDSDDEILGYLLIGTDNTARKEVEARLRWTEESFRLMVESVTDYAIVMLDPEGLVVSWNEGAERIQGYTADAIVGRHFSLFYTPADRQDGRPQKELDLAAAEGRCEVEGLRMRKDESTFWANVVFTSIRDADGNLRGFAKLTLDLTERRFVEAELINAKRVAEKASLAKSEFMSSMSHELRSPLNAILGFAQLLDSDTPPPSASQRADIAQILQAGWHLLKLIDEILDLAKVESGRVPLSQEPISITEVMGECLGMIDAQARLCDLTIVVPTPAEEHFVRADQTRVKQVLLNLLSNAVKYNRDGGTITISYPEHAAGRVRVCITDTGAGLDSSQLAHLFQPFNRLGQEAGGQDGPGIGLVVAKRLVELMDGSMGVESTVGVGSKFWFDLVEAEAPTLVEIGEPLSAALGPNTQPKSHTLLYVEDNPANLRLVEQIIARHSNLHLLTAVTGKMGISVAQSALPDVILMDINLPDMNGFDVLQFLRADPITCAIPAIAISANAMPRDIRNGIEAGFLRYITKPIQVDEFVLAVGEALEIATAGGAAASAEREAEPAPA
jgi:PAS domain S-box-containing protein